MSCRRGAGSCTNRSGTASARSCSAAARDVFIQSRDLRPLDRYFPELHEAFLRGAAGRLRRRRRDRDAARDGLDFDALQLRLHPAASRVAKLARETPSSFVAFDLLAVDGRDLRGSRRPSGARQLERAAARREPPIHLTPMTRDRARRGRMARPLRGGRPRRRGCKAGRRPVPARQARDDQGEARAHRRLRRGRLPLAQGRERRGRLAAARPVRRRGDAAPRGRDVGVHDGDAQGTRRGSSRRCASDALEDHPWRDGPRQERATSARMPGGAEPLERRQGPVVGAAADRARVRGEVRPPAGRPLPPRRPSSSAGAPTSGRPTAVTISSRSRRRTSFDEVLRRVAAAS